VRVIVGIRRLVDAFSLCRHFGFRVARSSEDLGRQNHTLRVVPEGSPNAVRAACPRPILEGRGNVAAPHSRRLSEGPITRRHSRPRERLKGAESVGNPFLSDGAASRGSRTGSPQAWGCSSARPRHGFPTPLLSVAHKVGNDGGWGPAWPSKRGQDRACPSLETADLRASRNFFRPFSPRLPRFLHTPCQFSHREHRS
jgi:hypothetical protein